MRLLSIWGIVSSGTRCDTGYALDEENRRASLACKTYKLKEGLILTYDQDDSFSEKGIQIEVVPVWRWLVVIS